MGRPRVFSAGSKALTTIARAQLGISSKLEQVPTVIGIFPVERALCARALSFCRPFSVGTQNETPQSKLIEFGADWKKSLNPDVKKYFGPFCNERALLLVHKAIKLMQPNAAKLVLKMAAIAQEPTKFMQYLYNTLFQTFLQARSFDSAVEVLEEMKKSEVPVNFKSFATLALFYLNAGMKMDAEETWELMKSYGFRKSKDVYCILLREYIEAGDDEGVERLLLRCSEAWDIESTLKVLAESGKTEETLTLIARMHAEGMYANRSSDLAITRCLCNANMIDEALKYLEQVQTKGGHSPSIKIFNILIGFLVQEKRLDDALKLVSNMKDIGCAANKKTYYFLNSGLLNSGDTEKAPCNWKR